MPYHEVIWTHPQLMIVSVLGTRRTGAANLTLFSFLYPYVRDNVSHPMPSQLEGFKNRGTCPNFAKKDGNCYDSRSTGCYSGFVLGIFCISSTNTVRSELKGTLSVSALKPLNVCYCRGCNNHIPRIVQA